MTTIYKYELAIEDEQEIWIPLGAKIISVQEQYRQNVIWAIVNTDKPLSKRIIHTYGTGNPIPDGYKRKHIGTVQNGGYVWHLFEAELLNKEQEDKRSVARDDK